MIREDSSLGKYSSRAPNIRFRESAQQNQSLVRVGWGRGAGEKLDDPWPFCLVRHHLGSCGPAGARIRSESTDGSLSPFEVCGPGFLQINLKRKSAFQGNGGMHPSTLLPEGVTLTGVSLWNSSSPEGHLLRDHPYLKQH